MPSGALRIPTTSFWARAIAKSAVYAQYPFRRVAWHQTVVYEGVRLRCFAHPYNATWRNERAVEIPIARNFITNQPRGSRGLELGNVLAHYQPVTHTVVDKYEIAPGVINEDIVDYVAPLPFDWSISISTIEHVGFNEPVLDTTKSAAAIGRLRSLLSPGGRLLVTAPRGFNPGLDACVTDGSLGPARESFFVRSATGWESVPRKVALAAAPPPAHPRVSMLWVAEFPSAPV